MGQLLQDENGGSLAQDHAIAVPVKRPAGFLRNVVSRRQYPHGAICGESKTRQGSLRGTGERQVDAAGGNLPEGLPQGDGPRSTGRGYRHVWSAQIELDGDMPGYRVRRYARYALGAQPVEAFFESHLDLVLVKEHAP